MGFQAPSTTLIRGVDRYMVDLESALENLEVTRYEFLDFEVDVHIDVALVYYVARDLLSKPRGEKTILVRVLDLYGLQPDGWTQIGSNIRLVPDDDESDWPSADTAHIGTYAAPCQLQFCRRIGSGFSTRNEVLVAVRDLLLMVRP